MARTFGSIQFELSHFAAANKLPGVDFELLSGWINQSYSEILNHRQWKGLEVRAVLQTTTTYRTGTVTATNGSTAVAGVGTTFALGMTGRQFRVPGRAESYTFAYVSATAGTLDRAYEGETVAGAAYAIFQTVYPLPARVKMIALMRNPRIGYPMELVTEENLDQANAARTTIGEPFFFLPGPDTADTATPIYHQVEIYPAPETAIGLNYTYIKLPVEFDGSNTSAEILPWVDATALTAGAKRLMQAHFERYEQSQAERIIRGEGLNAMSQVEMDTVGPSRLRMATRFTRHRRMRGVWGAG